MQRGIENASEQRLPAYVATAAQTVGASVCRQPTYSADVRMRLWSFRRQDGVVNLVRVVDGTWKDRHVFELQQLAEVARRLGLRPLVILVDRDGVHEFSIRDALGAMATNCSRLLRENEAKDRELRWQLNEIRTARADMITANDSEGGEQ